MRGRVREEEDGDAEDEELLPRPARLAFESTSKLPGHAPHKRASLHSIMASLLARAQRLSRTQAVALGLSIIMLLSLVIAGAVVATKGSVQGGVFGPSFISNATCSPSLVPRQECGYYGIQPAECQKLGCCWAPTTRPGLPWCFHPAAAADTVYVVDSKVQTAVGWNISLKLQAAGGGEVRRANPAAFTSLLVTVEVQGRERVHVKIQPQPQQQGSGSGSAEGARRWEVPHTLLPRPVSPSAATPDPLLAFDCPDVGQPFSFSISRTQAPTQAVALFNTSGFPLLFEQQYMQLSSHMPASSVVMGLGESSIPEGPLLPRNGKVLTLWNTDIGAMNPNVNLYGAHPVYMELRRHTADTGTGAQGGGQEPGQGDHGAHGVFLLSSNGMDVQLDPEAVTYRVIGGILDFYFFAGPSPEEVAMQYHEVIGHPGMPPRWALGFHQCRWGYPDLQTLEGVVQQYKEARIPLDVIWSDIDFMYENRLFTYDPDHYPLAQFKDFVDRLHAGGQHWVPILDPGITALPGFEPYERALKQDVFIKDRTGKPYLGQVWSGPTHWPDFLDPAVWVYWKQEIEAWRSSGPGFDGLWIDMNEPSNFCVGDVCGLTAGTPIEAGTECSATCQGPSDGDTLYHPPYAINIAGSRQPLAAKTISPTATHRLPGDLGPEGSPAPPAGASGSARHYDAHNLFSLGEAEATHNALLDITGERPFVLSRASFPGQGSYTAHWTGDNAATWDDLRWSISGILTSNLWGLPLVGADICGFHSDTSEELCARWLSAGAFYPFSRNHNEKGASPQEAYRWPATTRAAQRALGMRYQLLPYLYTCFYTVHVAGGTVARPPLSPFPSDPGSIEASGRQWMLGDFLMIAPVLQQGASGVTVHFPPGDWFSIWEDQGSRQPISGPLQLQVPAPLGEVPVYVRAGAIIPMARRTSSSSTAGATAGQGQPLTTAEAAAAPLSLLVAMPQPSSSVAAAAAAPLHAVRYMQRRHRGVGVAACSTSAAPPWCSWWAAHLSPPAPAAPASNLSALGLLYADNGTTLYVGAEAVSLEAWFAAGSEAPAQGQGWLRADVLQGGDTAPGAPGLEVDWVQVLGVRGSASGSGGGQWEVKLEGNGVEGARVEYRLGGKGGPAPVGELVVDLRGMNVSVRRPWLMEWSRS